MHFLESLASSCGAKINEPFVYTSFFPMPVDKYITFNSEGNSPSNSYAYLQNVINILAAPLRSAGISIIQIGDSKDREFSNCLSIKGMANQNQLAYIVKNSMLHFGADGLATHFSGGFDIPLVSIFSNNYSCCEKPYFGSSEKQILLTSYDRTTNKKPSYSGDEVPKSINLIRPEEIASAVLKLLGINYEIPFESIYFGDKYSSFIIQESIPNHSNVSLNPNLIVEIRADDDSYTEQHLVGQLSKYQKSIVVTDKPININVLRHFKANIQMVVFKITENDHSNFLSQVESIGCKLILISELPEGQLADLKIKYYEYGVINKIISPNEDKINELKKDINNLYYHSSKITASNDKVFPSQAAAKKHIPMKNLDDYNKVIDSPEFWKELDFYTIVRKK